MFCPTPTRVPIGEGPAGHDLRCPNTAGHDSEDVDVALVGRRRGRAGSQRRRPAREGTTDEDRIGRLHAGYLPDGGDVTGRERCRIGEGTWTSGAHEPRGGAEDMDRIGDLHTEAVGDPAHHQCHTEHEPGGEGCQNKTTRSPLQISQARK
jgi:hypothetical protein